MLVSVFLGPFSRFPADDRPLMQFCLDQAERAAAAGFAMVTFGEQHLNSYEPYSNPFLMAARLSPVLGDCWFGTTIVPLVFHHPLRLAEDASVVDLLLEGRFLMGMSAGRAGFSLDFETFGLPADRREEIFEAKLDALERIWGMNPGGEKVVLDGEWDKGVLDGRMMPIPYRASGPLTAVGTNTDATIERAAARGMSLFLGPCLRQDAARKLDVYRAAARAAGHPETQTELVLTRSLVTRHVVVGSTDDLGWERAERMLGRNPMMRRDGDPRSLRELSQVDLEAPGALADPANRNAGWVQSWLIAGGPESVRSQLLAYPAAGVPQVNTRFTSGQFNPTEMDDSFQLFVDEVLPGLDPERLSGPVETEIRPEHTQPLPPQGTMPPGDAHRAFALPPSVEWTAGAARPAAAR